MHLRTGVEDVPDDFSRRLAEQIQLRNHSGVAPEDVQDIVLLAAGLIDVPEGFPGQVFHPAEVFFGFRTIDIKRIHDDPPEMKIGFFPSFRRVFGNRS